MAEDAKKARCRAGLMKILGDPAGTRTQDPYIKSVLLYQLSYQIGNKRRCAKEEKKRSVRPVAALYATHCW